MKYFRYLSIAIMLLHCIACAKPKSYYPTVDNARMQQEMEYQKKLIKEHKAKEKKKKSDERHAMLNRLRAVAAPIKESGSRLCEEMAISKSCHFEFELAQKGGVNAYADGKKVVVMPGLMDFAESDEELAVVLGHEYAHNVMEHVASTKRNALLGQLAGIVLDGLAQSQGVNTQGNFGKLGGRMGVMRYSKDFEREADYIGLYITARAGFSIDKAPHLWRRMSLQNAKGAFLATTHPSNPERFLLLEEAAEEIRNKKRNNTTLIPDLKTDG